MLFQKNFKKMRYFENSIFKPKLLNFFEILSNMEKNVFDRVIVLNCYDYVIKI